jgi:N-methylhydantoinase A/oxoprolinase/acetone carboxylase beta subunit
MTDVRSALDRLDRECARLMAAEAVDPATVETLHFADMCYVGQAYHLEVPFPQNDGDVLVRLYDAFRALHDRVLGHATESPARIVNLRSVQRARGLADFGRAAETADATAAPRRRRIVPTAGGDPVEAAIYDRWSLAAGRPIAGPAIVEQTDTTTLVPAGWRATVDAHGNLMIERG